MAAKKETERRFTPLALVPVGVALALGSLMLPRAIPPTTLPAPALDGRALAATERADRERAARAESQRLPDDARALGQAVRDFNKLSVAADASSDPARVRRDLDASLRTVLALPNGAEAALDLRAVQLERFLAEVRAYERTGQSSKELEELGGSFVRSLQRAGWERDHTIAMDEHVRRVAFKIAWNATTQVTDARFEPTLDETRALYTFYFEHPHAPEAVRASLDLRRAAAKSKKDCEALDAGEALAAESWRLDKIDRLAKIDAAYPAGYARGVALYRLARYDESVKELQLWLEAHPEGPWALRARGHLRAAMSQRRL